MKGAFITFEGSEGSGKSTQLKLIYAYLKKKRVPVLLIREPGGVTISERVRQILLDVKNKHMAPECETMLYMAARAQLVAEVIEPALKKGTVVLCDRFLDSTIVYQGYGCGMDIRFIQQVGKFVTRSIKPNVTFFFDLPVQQGFARLKRKKDRIEQRNLQYHNKVRRGYLDLAKKEPRRIKIINAMQSKEVIHGVIRERIIKSIGMSV